MRGLAALGVGHEAYFYRTSAGAEVDLVLEGYFGLVPVEIKYTQTVSPAQLRSLAAFIAEKQCAFGVVINNDEQVRLYAENIIGVPFGCF